MESFSVVDWLDHLLGLPPSWSHEYLHVTMGVVVMLIILTASVLAWRTLRHTRRRLVPDHSVGLVNIFEVLVEGLLKLMEENIGPSARQHLPLIGSLFVYILVSNLIGAIPGFVPPTDNINTNLACALTVFIYYNVVGIRKQGLKKYLGHMAGPVIWLAPLIFVIELISHLVRPVSLSVRLFGNIMGDHIVLGIFSHLTPYVIPVIFFGMAVFVAFIQAFVFTLLSIIYITLAAPEDEHEHA